MNLNVLSRQAISDARAAVDLCKVKIAAFAALSAAMGAFLAHALPSFPAIAGVFILACGSLALNQVQERRIDALMARTRARPIPSGRISKFSAATISIFLLGLGEFSVFYFGGLQAGIAAASAVVVYNFIYTPLKTKSHMAVLVGAITGSIPPMIGWASCGRDIFETEILAVGAFFYTWQVPHFWLLLFNHPEDYREAGLKTIHDVIPGTRVGRLTFLWIFAAASGSTVLPLYLGSPLSAGNILLFASSAWLVLSSLPLLMEKPGFSPGVIFRKINIFILLVASSLVVGNWRII